MDYWQWLEIVGAAVGLVYLWFEYRASVWLWLTGIVMPALYIPVYYESGFYADMGINVWYLAAGLYGCILWMGGGRRRESGKKRRQLPVTHMPARYYVPVIATSLLFFAAIAWILIEYTDSTVPIGDAFTTALSITALWMLAHKYAEQWLFWIVVDAVCTGLYLYKGLYPTAALYGLYTVIAMFGYFKWVKMIDAAYNESR